MQKPLDPPTCLCSSRRRGQDCVLAQVPRRQGQEGRVDRGECAPGAAPGGGAQALPPACCPLRVAADACAILTSGATAWAVDCWLGWWRLVQQLQPCRGMPVHACRRCRTHNVAARATLGAWDTATIILIDLATEIALPHRWWSLTRPIWMWSPSPRASWVRGAAPVARFRPQPLSGPLCCCNFCGGSTSCCLLHVSPARQAPGCRRAHRLSSSRPPCVLVSQAPLWCPRAAWPAWAPPLPLWLRPRLIWRPPRPRRQVRLLGSAACKVGAAGRSHASYMLLCASAARQAAGLAVDSKRIPCDQILPVL